MLNYSPMEIFLAGTHLSYSYGFMEDIQRKQEWLILFFLLLVYFGIE